MRCSPSRAKAITSRRSISVDLFETLTYSGFIKVASKYFSTGMGEMYRDVLRSAYVKALQRYIPELKVEDTYPAPPAFARKR